MKYLIFFLMSFNLHAQNNSDSKDWSKTICPKNQEILAKEIIEFWLRGPTLSKKSHCLNKLKLTYIANEYTPPTEEISEAELIIQDDYKVTIEKITPDDLGEYNVNFKIKFKGKVITDSLTYMIFTKRSDQKKRSSPCASISLTPSRTMLLKSCL